MLFQPFLSDLLASLSSEPCRLFCFVLFCFFLFFSFFMVWFVSLCSPTRYASISLALLR